MNYGHGFKTTSVFLIFLMLILPSTKVTAEDDQNLGGRVLENNEGLPDVVVRIVNLSGGNALETKTDKNGCFKFKNIAVGTYTITVVYKGADYLLADKIIVAASQKLFACLAVAPNNVLNLLDPVSEKDRCRCKGFPLGWLFLGAGGATAAAILIPGEDASPAEP